jgi:hypothetical protein
MKKYHLNNMFHPVRNMLGDMTGFNFIELLSSIINQKIVPI